MRPLDRPVLIGTSTVPGVGKFETAGGVAAIKRFFISTSGLTATVTAGTLVFSDGQQIEVASQTVDLVDDRTNFIGVSILDGTLHALRKRVDCGTVWVGEVVTASGAVSSVVQYPAPVYPPGRVEKFKRAMQSSGHGLKLVTIGNSLVDGAYGASWTVFGAVFDSAETPTTYQIPNAADLVWKQYQYGGQKSADGLMWAGGVGRTVHLLRNGHSASVLVGQDYLQRQTVSGAVHIEAPASMGADLVVICDYYNTGRENLLMLEGIVRTARASGAEVVLMTDNKPRDTDGDIWGDFDQFSAIAETYGCAIADTASYLEELSAAGDTVYSDTAHPNATGVARHAATLRGVLCDYPLESSLDSTVPSGRAVEIETASDYPNGVVPRQADFIAVPASTDGSWVATTISGSSTYYSKIPSVILGGKTVSDCVLELSTGEYAYYCHPFTNRFDLIVETSNPSFSIQAKHPETGVLLSTLSPGADSAAVKLYEFLPASAVKGYTDPTGSESSSSPWRNMAVKLECSSGTARILGAVFWTVPHSEVPARMIRYGGLWSDETQESGTLPSAPYTDTIGSSIEFSFTGTCACVVLAAHSAAGKVDAWVDGVKTHTAHDLYTSTSGVMTRSLILWPARSSWTTGGADVGFGHHTARIKYVSNNGSVGSVVAGSKRRVQVLGIHQLDAR